MFISYPPKRGGDVLQAKVPGCAGNDIMLAAMASTELDDRATVISLCDKRPVFDIICLLTSVTR